MFTWMSWTLPVAVFFVCIGLLLVAMTLWEVKSPTTPRRGWLPMETTRGDRLFIGLLIAAYLNLIYVGLAAWLRDRIGLETEPSLWIGFSVSMLALVTIMRKG